MTASGLHPLRPQARRLRGTKRLVTVSVVALIMGSAISMAWAFWTTGTVGGSNGAAAAVNVQQGATPTASAAAQTVTVSWAASTLSTGQAVDGYIVKRYDANTLALQSILSACGGTITATTCIESSVPGGTWKYSVTPAFAANWQGAESDKSGSVVVTPGDSTPPINAISLSGITGAAIKNGDTIYYRGTNAGSFTLTNALSDADSGPASSTTAALGGITTGWTHAPSTVSTPSGGPYISDSFQWGAATTSAPTEIVTGTDVATNTAQTTLSFVNDSTPPTAGSITYDNTYTAGRSVTVTFTAGSDAGAGIATRRLQRAEALLTGGTCGTFGSFTDLGPVDPTSPYADGLVVNGNCYRYQYAVTDQVGNQGVTTSADTAKVDYAGAVNATTGLLSQWRLGESTISDDTMTDTTKALTAHVGETGASWTHLAGSSNAVISNANRARKNGTTYSWDYVSGVPTDADYTVEADLVRVAAMASDRVGVMVRLDPATSSFYVGEYFKTNDQYSISKFTGGVWTKYVASITAQAVPAVGSTTKLRLEVSGAATTTLKLYVNGSLLLTGTDTTTPFTAAGRAGVMDGDPTLTTLAKNDSRGMHVDNFRVMPRATDSKGVNPGGYFGGPTLGSTGALIGDSNTAATFDGVNDYVQVVGSTGIPSGGSVRSVEAWFKTSSAARQVLFSYGSLGVSQEYGLWLNAGGSSMMAWGYGINEDKTFTLTAAVNDGAWHQVVQTFNGTSLTLYLDGVALPSQAATRNTVMDAYGFAIGAVLTPGDPNSGGYFAGSIDEVSFYTTVLNQATVTDHYQIGTADVSGPTGGSVGASGLVGTGARYSMSMSLTVVLDKGTDPAGLASSGAELRRASATLTSAGGTADGVCGSFGSYAVIATDPVSPRVDTVTDQTCYRYQYVVADTLAHTTTYTSSDIKVDSTAPSVPTIAFSTFSNTYWSGVGSNVYYRSTAGTGSFTTTASATDTASGISAFTFPALGANWSSTPGALGVNTYSWSGSPAAPGSVGVSATSNASASSSSATFTLTSDITAPTAGTVSYPDATQTTTAVSVTFTTGTDTGSGIATRLLQRAAAPLTGTVCGTYGAFATVVGGTNPTSPFADTVNLGSCYQYRYVVTDNVDNQDIATSTSVVKAEGNPPYDETVLATSGLVNYYRLGEGAATLGTSDSFTGTAGALLTARVGEVGATWAFLTGSANTEQISDAGRARRNGTGYTVNYTTATPASADYSVEADLFVKSNLANDRVGLIARLDTAPTYGSYYMARWEPEDTSWNIMEYTNGAGSYLNYVAGQPALVVGQTYRLKLTVSANALSLYVNGVLTVSTTDATLTAAGKAGIMDGEVSGTANKSNTAGIHIDDFQVTPSTYPREADSKGTNTGDYFNGVTLGAAGALTTGANTAAQFDGVNDHACAPRQISADFSIELWFKSTQGIGTGTQWWQGAGLVDADASGTTNDFGLSLRSDGKIVAGVGGGAGDTSIVSSTGGYNDGLWHHVVFTRTQSSGVFTLYVDGVSRGTATNNTGLLTAAPRLFFGRIATGGGLFTGTLDEIAIYNSALAAPTIAAHHAAR